MLGELQVTFFDRMVAVFLLCAMLGTHCCPQQAARAIAVFRSTHLCVLCSYFFPLFVHFHFHVLTNKIDMAYETDLPVCNGSDQFGNFVKM